MGFEQLVERPKKPNFIAFTYAEQLADKLKLEWVVLSETDNGWEAQILEIDQRDDGQRTGPTLNETNLFVSKLTEFLDEDFPQYEWRDMISVTNYLDAYRITFKSSE